MKFSLTATALLSFAASAFAQSSAASGATPNAGVAVTAPGLGVSFITNWYLGDDCSF